MRLLCNAAFVVAVLASAVCQACMTFGAAIERQWFGRSEDGLMGDTVAKPN